MASLRKRIVTASIALLASMSLVACSGGSGTSGKDGAKKYRVAYIARAQADSFAAWLANEMKNSAKDYKDIKLDVFDGQAQDEVENTLIENAISNKYDVIVVQPNNGEAQRPYVEKAVQAGIKTITTNARISGIKGSSSVDANPYEQAKVVAELAIKNVPKDGKVVVLDGPGGNFHASERRKAWKAEFFDKRPDVKILAENVANWNKDEAMKIMEDWSLAHAKIDAIISMNDNMAAGALEAVRNKPNFKNMWVYGVDGTPEACLLIKDGLMTATTLQNASELAGLIMKTAHQLATGENKEINVDIGNPVISKENVDKYIDLYKKSGLIK